MLTLCVLALSALLTSAQSLHLIVFCDTNDAKIGQAMSHDHDNIVREFGNVATFIDYDLLTYDYNGDDCSKSNLLQVIDELEFEPDDIAVFFYSGHGTRAENNAEDPFPQMALGSSYDSEFVPLQQAVNKIAAKNPKFLLALANCCNMEQPGVTVKSLLSQMAGATSVSDVDTDAYVKLFCDPKGTAIMTSSKAGQYSWCISTEGGMFTCDFFDVLLLVGQGKVTPDWESVLSQVKEKTSSRTIAITEPPYKAEQEPYYEVRTGEARIKPKKDRDNSDRRDDSPKEKRHDSDSSNSALTQALNSLVDAENSREMRLQSIPYILNTYFAPGAKVRTLGRNGMTVDYESASDFLRRIVLSRRIARITVINQTGDPKNTEISIHEVHK